MRISRLYLNASLQAGISLELPEQASHYLANVLRLGSGDTVHLFNNSDGEFSASVQQVSRKRVTVLLDEQIRKPVPDKLTVHLAVGLSRGDRMDYLIQKATELGVSRISPLYTEFGEVKFKQEKRLDNKLRHWRQVAISACEQSGRLSVPEICEPRSFSDWLPEASETVKIILQPGGETRLTQLPVKQDLCALSGPEGGFSETELSLAEQAGFVCTGMGPRVLRTETAPIAALAILQASFGDI